MKKILALLAASLLFTGCASVSYPSYVAADQAVGNEKKKFAAPAQGKAGLYIYRDSILGPRFTRDIWVDGKCIGATASNVFFYTEVEGGKWHKLETQSEVSPNVLALQTEAGKNYFVQQLMKPGLFEPGAYLMEVPEKTGITDIMSLPMGQQGYCFTQPTSHT